MRLCTYNVHNWTDPHGRANTRRVIALMQSLRCDVLALQEVSSPSDLRRLADALDMHVTRAPAAWASNALLTRAPPRWRAELTLDVADSELRSAALTAVDSELGEVVLAATHLDHIRERCRVTQFDQLLAALAARGESSLLLGDLNALRPADYPPERIEAIEAERARNAWESPEDALTRALDVAGWIDLARLHIAGSLDGYAASLASPMPEALTRTSRFDTRVDYALASPALARRLRVVGAEVIASDASDHSPVVIDVSAA